MNLRKDYLYPYSEDASSLSMRLNCDCCGVMDNGSLQCGSCTSISGQGDFDIKCCCGRSAELLEGLSMARLIQIQ